VCGSTASGHFEVEVGDCPEAGQDSVAGLFEPTLFIDVLVDKLLLNGSTMLKHVRPDSMLEFGVGGAVRV
jgi:hypothetical protein